MSHGAHRRLYDQVGRENMERMETGGGGDAGGPGMGGFRAGGFPVRCRPRAVTMRSRGGQPGCFVRGCCPLLSIPARLRALWSFVVQSAGEERRRRELMS